MPLAPVAPRRLRSGLRQVPSVRPGRASRGLARPQELRPCPRRSRSTASAASAAASSARCTSATSRTSSSSPSTTSPTRRPSPTSTTTTASTAAPRTRRTAHEGAIDIDGKQDQGPRREGPGEAPVEGARRRHRARVHRPLHRQGEGRRAHRGGRQEGDHQRARQGARRDDRPRRQHRGVRRRQAHVISCGSCTTNCLAPVAKVLLDIVRHRARPDDDDPLVHQRPGRPRHPAPQGRPAPRARGGA